MSEEHPHPLLQQLPLTVSPYLSLPTATTLPYTYKSVPSTLPQSVTTVDAPSNDPSHQQSDQQQYPKPAYVVSQTGHAAHPDAIIESCQALRAHLDKLQAEAEAAIHKWDSDIVQRELAEKRRVAPGWLDVGEENRLLVPERSGSTVQQQADPTRIIPIMTAPANVQTHAQQGAGSEGEALDRAFGGLNVR
ncbi:hypothetical protein BT63DRAFT_460758 [Microthyrium microscopicum]|uniref:Uncharacterized protein n=1 Tax=Microthyrium microscopicum TaxID=703497 RepID=A0A6A6TXD7_9PEZI|nr:hypothetical protein BT63DRAFT_460758 [Microthyrium microscopicum]